MSSKNKNPTFIDLFAGCGGFSLGLMQAGWRGRFAIENNPQAFKTLNHNLIDGETHNPKAPRFDWPNWLEKEPFEIKRFIKIHQKQLEKLQGKVQLVAGGPPCQSFSFAGKRSHNDSRNTLFKSQLEIVDIIRPEFALLENVQGIDFAHKPNKNIKKRGPGRISKSYMDRIWETLEKQGYWVETPTIIMASDFGVPQYRPRYYILGIRRDILNKSNPPNLEILLSKLRKNFLKKRGLRWDTPVTVSQAISDLKIKGNQLVNCEDEDSPPGFKEIQYKGPRSNYQKLMHGNLNGRQLNSLRLINHSKRVKDRCQKIIDTCPKGVMLSPEARESFGLRKQSITPLAPDKPSHTLTTLPDDLIHYDEPRAHTVREHARLQSFPDWFEFTGNYTTGGTRRNLECPRYTQVGNAVPPLIAEIIGEALMNLIQNPE